MEIEALTVDAQRAMEALDYRRALRRLWASMMHGHEFDRDRKCPKCGIDIRDYHLIRKGLEDDREYCRKVR